MNGSLSILGNFCFHKRMSLICHNVKCLAPVSNNSCCQIITYVNEEYKDRNKQKMLVISSAVRLRGVKQAFLNCHEHLKQYVTSMKADMLNTFTKDELSTKRRQASMNILHFVPSKIQDTCCGLKN